AHRGAESPGLDSVAFQSPLQGVSSRRRSVCGLHASRQVPLQVTGVVQETQPGSPAAKLQYAHRRVVQHEPAHDIDIPTDSLTEQRGQAAAVLYNHHPARKMAALDVCQALRKAVPELIQQLAARRAVYCCVTSISVPKGFVSAGNYLGSCETLPIAEPGF